MSVWGEWGVCRRFSRNGANSWETNMAVTPQQQAQGVVWYAKFSSVTRIASFSTQYNCHHVPSHRDIVKWYNISLENGLTMPHRGGKVRTGTGRKTFGKPWFRVHGSRCATCQLRKTFHTLHGVPPTRVRTINWQESGFFSAMFSFLFVTSQTDHPVYLRDNGLGSSGKGSQLLSTNI
jgi:hypothetical protein